MTIIYSLSTCQSIHQSNNLLLSFHKPSSIITAISEPVTRSPTRPPVITSHTQHGPIKKAEAE